MNRCIEEVSASNLRRDLRHLCVDPFTFRAVNYTAPWHAKNSLDEVDEWLESRMRSIPGLEVFVKPNRVKPFRCRFDPSYPRSHQYLDPFPEDPWHDARNLLGVLRGSRSPESVVYLLAHKDSQSWINGPGAHDNGTGTAALLELMRILATCQLRHTFRFLLCNEEHWPWHSATEAREAAENGDQVDAVVNVDSICGRCNRDIMAGHHTMWTLSSTPEGRPLARFVAEAATRHGIPLECHVGERKVGDDDGSFVKAGFPRAVVCQGSHPYADEEYHLPGDTFDRVDIDCLVLSTQAILAAFLDLDTECQ